MKSHVTVKEMAGTKIIYAMLLACYYWMWARRDWHSFYDVIQNMVFLFTFLFFVLQAVRIRQYGKGEKDQAAIRNLRRIDAIGLKVMVAAVIAFASAIADLEGRIAGYALVGAIFALTVARFLALCLMSRNTERR
jgi:small-conductance mechanosensitive channel